MAAANRRVRRVGPGARTRQRGARWRWLSIVVLAITGLLILGLGIEFFTTQSTVIVIGYYIAAIVLGRRQPGHIAAPRLRGGMTSWILITAVVNQVVLRAGSNPFLFLFALPTRDWPQEFADLLVHYIVPAMVLADWVVWGARMNVRWRDGLIWTIYPVLYICLMMVRGAVFPQVDERYPYAFLDPQVEGWPGMSSGLPLVMLLMIAIPITIVATAKATRTIVEVGSRTR